MIGAALSAFGLAVVLLPSPTGNRLGPTGNRLGPSGNRLDPRVAGASSAGAPAAPGRFRSPGRAERRRAIALALDLLASALRVGLPPDAALAAVSAALTSTGAADLSGAADPLAHVGRLIQLGADPAQAWSSLAQTSGFERVAAAGRRCADSGARLADALTSAAVDLRNERHAAALASANRVGVWSLLPLGLCFLPAFVCLGIVPVVGALAGQLQSSY